MLESRNPHKTMNKEESTKMYNRICIKVSEEINRYESGDTSISTIKKIFDEILIADKSKAYIREETVKERAIRGCKASRDVLKEKIMGIVMGMAIPMTMIDTMIANYTIDYFSSTKRLYRGNNPMFIKKLKKLFIRLDSPKEVRLAKFVQMIYQDLYGVGVLDEFLYLGVDKDDMSKIEEVAAFGGEKIWLEISGDKELLKLVIDKKTMKNICNRLCKNAQANLNEMNTEVETETLRGDRVTLRCPPYSVGYSLNLRLHYENAITTKERLRLGSTDPVLERFFDAMVHFSPCMVIVGGQGTGKTTILRDIYRRFPANTVIGTVESSRELALGKFPHLIVEELQTLTNRNYDKVLEDMLRAGLDMMALGEVRNSTELEIMIQVMLRQGRGSSCTFHGSNAKDALYTMRTLLMRTHNYQSENQALFELCRALDFMIVLDKRDGKRFIKEICAIPDIRSSEIEDVEPHILFRHNLATGQMESVGEFPEVLAEELLARCYYPKAMEQLRALCHSY